MKNLKPFSVNGSSETGSILIVTTIVVLLLSAISASVMLQIQSDSQFTQFTKHRVITENIVRGAIHASLNQLNLGQGDPSGNLGVITWNPTLHDVGLDGIAGTGDQGEGDGYPTFSLPNSSGPGEPGGDWIAVSVTDDEQQVFQAYYAVFDEDLGNNGIDDNNNDPGDGSGIDEFEETNYHRLKAIATYAGQVKKLEILVGSEGGVSLSEVFFKAIYAGNTSEDPDYFLDLGGPNRGTPDDVEGDIYIHGNIRLHNASLTWQRESYNDANGNGAYDLGETINDKNGQEPGFLNFGTEASGDVNLRSTIKTRNWKKKDPNIGGSPAKFTSDAEYLAPPDFAQSMEGVTINVSEEIEAKGTNYTLIQSGSANVRGLAVRDKNNPSHLFMKANDNQRNQLMDYYGKNGDSPYVNNGLDNYVLKDTTNSNVSKLYVSPDGNEQVYFIDGNLLFGMDGAVEMYFVPLDNATKNDPLRITFIVRGNIVLNDDFVYRNSGNLEITNPNWNPYDDAFALIALKNEDAPNPDLTGNIQFADFGSRTFERIDGYLYAENNFVSEVGYLDRYNNGITVNGMMAAGNHVKFNQEFINGEWRALPDSTRNQFLVNFDTRIREFVNNNNWLPGLPGGSNRALTLPASNFTNIISWTER